MRLILPRASRHFFRSFGALLMLVACHRAEPPVPPGPPLPAEPDVVVGTADQECGALIGAIATFDKCPHADEEDHAWARGWTHATEEAFAAGKKGALDDHALHSMALACLRAAVSVQHATERCLAGPKPRVD